MASVKDKQPCIIVPNLNVINEKLDISLKNFAKKYGCDEKASFRKGYKKATLRCHPDKGNSEDDFKTLNTDYSAIHKVMNKVLSDRKWDDMNIKDILSELKKHNKLPKVTDQDAPEDEDEDDIAVSKIKLGKYIPNMSFKYKAYIIGLIIIVVFSYIYSLNGSKTQMQTTRNRRAVSNRRVGGGKMTLRTMFRTIIAIILVGNVHCSTLNISSVRKDLETTGMKLPSNDTILSMGGYSPEKEPMPMPEPSYQPKSLEPSKTTGQPTAISWDYLYSFLPLATAVAAAGAEAVRKRTGKIRKIPNKGNFKVDHVADAFEQILGNMFGKHPDAIDDKIMNILKNEKKLKKYNIQNTHNVKNFGNLFFETFKTTVYTMQEFEAYIDAGDFGMSIDILNEEVVIDEDKLDDYIDKISSDEMNKDCSKVNFIDVNGNFNIDKFTDFIYESAEKQNINVHIKKCVSLKYSLVMLNNIKKLSKVFDKEGFNNKDLVYIIKSILENFIDFNSLVERNDVIDLILFNTNEEKQYLDNVIDDHERTKKNIFAKAVASAMANINQVNHELANGTKQFLDDWVVSAIEVFLVDIGVRVFDLKNPSRTVAIISTITVWLLLLMICSIIGLGIYYSCFWAFRKTLSTNAPSHPLLEGTAKVGEIMSSMIPVERKKSEGATPLALPYPQVNDEPSEKVINKDTSSEEYTKKKFLSQLPYLSPEQQSLPPDILAYIIAESKSNSQISNENRMIVTKKKKKKHSSTRKKKSSKTSSSSTSGGYLIKK